jgi:hypothetical protein
LDLLDVARDLLDLLDRIKEAGAYGDTDAIQEAKRLYYLLAPVQRYIYGGVAIFDTSIPPYVWWKRARERASQAVAILEAGEMSRVPPPKPTWNHRDLPILQAIANGEEAGAPLRFDDVVRTTAFDPTVAETGLRALLDAGLAAGLDATTFGGFDVLELRLTQRGRVAAGLWPAEGSTVAAEEPQAERPTDSLDGGEFEYDVAVSFAGPDRKVVEEVVEALKASGISVWYDADKAAELWGEDLSEILAEVYSSKARYVMVFLSKDYTERDWTTFELEVARKASRSRKTAYVLPVVLSVDVPPIVGLPKTVAHVSLIDRAPAEVAGLLSQKLKAARGRNKESEDGSQPPRGNP